MDKNTYNIGYDVISNNWDFVDAFTEKEAEQILIQQVSDDKNIPKSQVVIHAIYNTDEE